MRGDYVLVSKICYGPRILNLFKLIFEKEAEFIWMRGIKHVKINDIIVFNYPQCEYLGDSVYFIFGTPLVKRCYGVPGDSVRIRRNDAKIIEGGNFYNNLFPYDTLLHWSLNNYGPLFVPRKGDTLQLIPDNLKRYYNVLIYEDSSVRIKNDSMYIKGIYSEKHYFKYNYYFMLGDNFYNSRDSRFWGFLPETHIIGKVVMVLFSLDPNEPWYKKVRFNRLMKRVN